MNDELTTDFHFPSGLYRIQKPEFLQMAREAIEEHLRDVHDESDVYPISQTDDMVGVKLDPLLGYIVQTAWNILNSQGYDVERVRTYMMDFWGQRLRKGAQHVEHTHAFNAQISGFYFTEVPNERVSSPYIADPRPGKRQINWYEKEGQMNPYATDRIFLNVQPGELVMFNSWLPHGFMPNSSEMPFKFIHFNIGLMPVQ